MLFRTHPRYLSFGFLHFFFSAVGQTFFISLFVAGMSERMGWGEGTFAAIYSSVTLVAAFTLPVIGKQVDVLRVRYVSTAAALAIALGCTILATTTFLPLLIVGLFVVRLGGQGVLPLIGSTTIGRFFTENRGRALSSSVIGISVAEVVLPPAATYLIASQGYSLLWALAAGAMVLVFIPLVWTLVRRYDHFQRADTVAEAATATAEPVASWTRSEVLRDARFRLLIPIFIFIPFLFTGLVFNQSVIGEIRGYSPAWMAIGLSTYGFVRVICLLTAGGVTDRFGAGTLLRFVYVPTLIALSILLFVEHRWSIPLFFGFAGVTAGVESVMLPALWAERYGPRFLGTIKSTVRLIVVVASAAAPIVFSYGLRLGLEVWLGVMLAYGVLCLLLSFREYRLAG